MLLVVNGKDYKLSLRKWNEADQQYEPDFFHDVETEYTDGQEVSGENFEALCDFWESEVADFNAWKTTEIFGEPEGTLLFEVE